jgi:hypothetical protein
VLHELGIETIEAVGVVAIRVVMPRDLIQAAAARIVGGRPQSNAADVVVWM